MRMEEPRAATNRRFPAYPARCCRAGWYVLRLDRREGSARNWQLRAVTLTVTNLVVSGHRWLSKEARKPSKMAGSHRWRLTVCALRRQRSHRFESCRAYFRWGWCGFVLRFEPRRRCVVPRSGPGCGPPRRARRPEGPPQLNHALPVAPTASYHRAPATGNPSREECECRRCTPPHTIKG